MALSYKARKRWALVILLVWMPVFVVIAVTILTTLPPLPKGVELLIYVALGLLCFLPFRRVFLGIGQADPDEEHRD